MNKDFREIHSLENCGNWASISLTADKEFYVEFQPMSTLSDKPNNDEWYGWELFDTLEEAQGFVKNEKLKVYDEKGEIR